MIGVIWAQTTSGIIGAAGGIPWHLPEDLKHFKDVTAGHPVIMGRKTWESLPSRNRPLPGRTNIVVTTREHWEDKGAITAGSLPSAIAAAEAANPGGKTWVIGGGQIYREALDLADTLLITTVDLDLEGDTLAPQHGPGWTLVALTPNEGWAVSAGGIRYRMEAWARQ